MWLRHITAVCTLLLVTLLPAALVAETVDQTKTSARYIPTIDLRQHDFVLDGLARIDGDWAMYWGQLLEPAQLEHELAATPPGLFPMPGTWNSFELNGDALSGPGYATFAVRVLLPPELDRGALRIEPASTSYRLWINGREAAANGIPGTSAATTTPARAIRNPVFETADGGIDLLLQVANFDHRVGGMWRPIWIGRADEIAAHDIIDVSYDLLMLGICLAFAAYNLLIYLAGSRRSAAPLLFAGFFLSVAIRAPTLGAVLLTRVLPGFPWHAVIFIEYMTGHLIIAFFCSALQLAYPRILGRYFRLAVIALMGAFALFLVIAGVTRYSLIINAFLVAVLALLAYPTLRLTTAAATGHGQAKFGILATLVVLGIVLSEWAHFSELVLSRDATPIGFLLGLLSAPPAARAATHLALTAVTVLLVLAAASLLLYKVSDGLFGVAAREAAAAGMGFKTNGKPRGDLDPPEPLTAEAGHAAFRARHNLTTREAEIAAHAAEGLSNKEIAAVLYISEATVRTHIYRIFKKTNSQNRTELSKAYYDAASRQPT
ncbi:MAG: hypothetical protein EA428_09905 [Spirochaetaceae bacterium]|nr:MAG: hypothetical protein EA428_09905 [Spirochaetaceae bacterium]